jgi:ribosomal protein S18 acetylase RimI-like enzyme
MVAEFIFRWAGPDDAAALTRAAAAFFVDTFGAANRPEDMQVYVAGAFSEARQRAELADGSNRILLATTPDGEIAGYAHLRLGAVPADAAAPDEGTPAVEIARLYTDRRWHGRGLGAHLMARALNGAREWRAATVWLGVWEQNARAIAFYQKQGFEIIGEQQFMLGSDRQRDLVMAVALTRQK